MFYATAIMVIKISILAMHWRLFPTRLTKAAYIILGGLNVAWWLAIILVTSFKCQPLGRTFDPYIPGECVNNWSFFLAFGIPNIITDAGILALAIYKVAHLHLPLMKRVGLSAVFLAGACAIAASCIRLYYYCEVEIEDANGHAEEVTSEWSLLLEHTSILPPHVAATDRLPTQQPRSMRFYGPFSRPI